jgi:hypothetical protein
MDGWMDLRLKVIEEKSLLFSNKYADGRIIGRRQRWFLDADSYKQDLRPSAMTMGTRSCQLYYKLMTSSSIAGISIKLQKNVWRKSLYSTQ